MKILALVFIPKTSMFSSLTEKLNLKEGTEDEYEDVLEIEDSPYEVARVTIERGCKLEGLTLQNIKQITKLNFLIAPIV